MLTVRFALPWHSPHPPPLPPTAKKRPPTTTKLLALLFRVKLESQGGEQGCLGGRGVREGFSKERPVGRWLAGVLAQERRLQAVGLT